MLILALDTSSPTGSIALLQESTVLAIHESTPSELFSGSILRDTKVLLERAATSLEQIDVFGIDAGPGSFTGLRVGLTTVKGWAEVWKKPIVPVSGLEAIAAQVAPEVRGGKIVAAVTDAQRAQVFGGIFRTAVGSLSLERVGEETLSSADEFLEGLLQTADDAGVILACASPEVIRPAVERRGRNSWAIQVVSSVLAPTIGQIAYVRAIRGEVTDALHLDANYIRRSDAEMKWTSA